MISETWEEITYEFPNFNSYTVEVWERINNFIPHFIIDYLSKLGLKLIHVSKRSNTHFHYGLGGVVFH